MKKVWIKSKNIYLFILLLFLITSILNAQEWGDINSSGSIDILDALLIAQFSVNLNPQNFNQQVADVSGDGSINVLDALLIAQFTVGLINEFPVASTGQPTPTPDQEDLSFIVTAVNDDLDNQDLYLMSNGLSNLGYQQMVLDTDVFTGEMISYLQQYYTTLYHTGHGSDGIVVTSDGRISSYSTTINIKNTIFATCLTLTDTNWKNAFGQNAQCILGYTKVSYDITDNNIVNNFISRLNENYSYPVAWYLVNSGIGLVRDRWACYVREGGSINEYSARTGVIPKVEITVSDLVSLDSDGKLFVSMDILENIDSFPVSPLPNTSYMETDLEVEGEIGEFGDVLGECTLSSSDALNRVEQYVNENGGLPSDAAMDNVISIVSQRESGSLPATMGYVVRYIREIEGTIIRSNGMENHIAYLVGQTGNIITRSSYWPDFYQKEVMIPKRTLLNVNEAMYLAAPSISELIKDDTTLTFTDVIPVFGTYGPNSDIKDIVPAFSFIATDGTFIVVDAVTGELIR